MKANQINKEMCDLFTYCENSGKLYWKYKVAIRTKIGDIAGTITPNGYIMVSIKNKQYMAHRIVYTIFNGEQDWSYLEIDHINGKRNDNRIENLRLVNRHENMKNKKKYKSNSSGYVGVHWNKKLLKWQGQVRINRKSIHVGVFESVEDCANAVKAKRDELRFHINHGREK